MEQSVFGLEQQEQSYEAFHKHFLAKIYLLLARTQFWLKINFFTISLLPTSNAKIWDLWSQNRRTFFKSDVA